MFFDWTEIIIKEDSWDDSNCREWIPPGASMMKLRRHIGLSYPSIHEKGFSFSVKTCQHKLQRAGTFMVTEASKPRMRPAQPTDVCITWTLSTSAWSQWKPSYCAEYNTIDNLVPVVWWLFVSSSFSIPHINYCVLLSWWYGGCWLHYSYSCI